MGTHVDIKKRAEFALFSKFAQERLLFHPNLVVPVMVLYRAHVNWAVVHGGGLVAETFMKCLEEAGVSIISGGKGKLKRAAVGVGVLPV